MTHIEIVFQTRNLQRKKQPCFCSVPFENHRLKRNMNIWYIRHVFKYEYMVYKTFIQTSNIHDEHIDIDIYDT